MSAISQTSAWTLGNAWLLRLAGIAVTIRSSWITVSHFSSCRIDVHKSYTTDHIAGKFRSLLSRKSCIFECCPSHERPDHELHKTCLRGFVVVVDLTSATPESSCGISCAILEGRMLLLSAERARFWSVGFLGVWCCLKAKSKHHEPSILVEGRRATWIGQSRGEKEGGITSRKESHEKQSTCLAYHERHKQGCPAQLCMFVWMEAIRVA